MSLDRIRYKEQRDTITSLKERLEADSVSVNTMGAGSVLVRFWKEGDPLAVGEYVVTRTGKAEPVRHAVYTPMV